MNLPKLVPDEAKPDTHFPLDEDPAVHLRRLLVPQDLEDPFYKTIHKDFRSLLHPRKFAPLEITSKPVDPSELKGLNGL